MVIAATAAIGCPGKTTGPAPEMEPKPAPVSALDQEFVDYPEKDLVGTTYQPRALGRPGMIRVTSSRKTTLARQRKKAARRDAKPADVHLLVTLLWDDAAKAEEGGDIQRTLRREALDALQSLYARVGDGKATAETLQMLASANMWALDWTAAEAAYKELLERFPDRPDRLVSEMWLVVLYLQRDRFTDAQELASRWEPSKLDALGSYTLAWVRFIKGDAAGAREAILAAAAGWQGSGRRGLARDLLLILARTGTEPRDAIAAVEQLTGDRIERREVLLDRLASEYQSAGRYRQALEVLVAATNESDEATEDNGVETLLRRAEYHFLLGEPVEAAELAVGAHKALSNCTGCSAALRERVDSRVSQFAVFFHDTYHDCLDPRYFEGAEKLYTYLMNAPGVDREARRGNLANLKDTRDRANPAKGRHNPDILYKLAVARSETVRACYEGVLLGHRVLNGTLTLRLEIASDGTVAGAATEPAAGLQGMPRVARCVLEQVRDWTFPSRTVPGTTTMAISFLLHPET